MIRPDTCVLCHDRIAGTFFGSSPSTTSDNLGISLTALDAVLTQIPEARVEFPNTQRRRYLAAQALALYPNLPRGSFACMDGLLTKIPRDGDDEKQQLFYNGYVL